MASAQKNLSSYNKQKFSGASKMRIGIVVSEWNSEITDALFEGAKNTLLENGVKEKNILRENVPGSYELPLAAQFFCQMNLDAVICLGCVIQGETRHFEFICHSVAQGMKDVSLKYNKPVIFGVLTTDNLQQAKARAGGKHGNKGVEAAVTAIRMVEIKKGKSRFKI